jgi:DNA modification methylase
MSSFLRSPALVIENLPIAQIRINPSNPRLHRPKQVRQIAASIREFGFRIPVLVDGTGKLVAGHGRLQAAKLVGMTEIPTIRLEGLDEKQLLAFSIADNRLCETAEWSKTLLAEQLKFLSESDINFSLDVVGFELDEIELMIEGLLPVGDDLTTTAPDSEIDTQTRVCQPGHLWLLDKHRLYCGDSLSESSFSALMQGRLAKMIFVDPPYNLSVQEVTGLGSIQHRNFAMAAGEMSEQQFCDFLSRAFQLLSQNSEDGSLHYIFMDWRHIGEIFAAGRKVYSELKNLCIWAKTNAGMGSFYRSQHEMIFVYKRGTAPHCNNIQLGEFGRYRSNLWQYAGMNSFSRTTEEGNLLALHPTVKPIPLVSDAILDSSRRGDIVLDSFIGSGTTLLAAERTGRVCYGIELDARYIDLAVRRWQALTGKTATEAVTGRNFSEIEKEVDNATQR